MTELTIQYGKYKGRLIDDIIKDDFNYAKWMFNQPFTSDELKSYIEASIDVNDYVIKFGKYKHKSISWIKKNDKIYLEWLKNNQYVKDKCPQLIEAIIKV